MHVASALRGNLTLTSCRPVARLWRSGSSEETAEFVSPLVWLTRGCVISNLNGVGRSVF
jgi:hypothetical protein